MQTVQLSTEYSYTAQSPRYKSLKVEVELENVSFQNMNTHHLLEQLHKQWCDVYIVDSP